jgi:hypothetical protein
VLPFRTQASNKKFPLLGFACIAGKAALGKEKLDVEAEDRLRLSVTHDSSTFFLCVTRKKMYPLEIPANKIFADLKKILAYLLLRII